MTLFIYEKKDSTAYLMAQSLRRRNAESRVILTFDLDFGEIIALSGGKPVSVILFRLHNTRAVHVLERLKKGFKRLRG